MRLINCETCGVELEAKTYNHKYCKQCAADKAENLRNEREARKLAGLNVLKVKCGRCGVNIETTSHSRKYCKPCVPLVAQERAAKEKEKRKNAAAEGERAQVAYKKKRAKLDKFIELLSLMTECGDYIGGPDNWDEPIWSGRWIMDFFKGNKISKSDMGPDVAKHLADLIHDGSEHSVPKLRFNMMEPELYDHNIATSALSGIRSVMTDEQMDAIADAEYTARGAWDNGADRWEEFFSELYIRTCEISFHQVNGYEFSANQASEMDYTPVKKQNKTPKKRKGYVYLVKEVGGFHHKIGRAVDTQDRLRTFSVKLPFKVNLEHEFECDDYISAEREMHLKYKSKRVDGEWFYLTEEDLFDIKNIASYRNGEFQLISESTMPDSVHVPLEMFNV